jgi:hypothetical protein
MPSQTIIRTQRLLRAKEATLAAVLAERNEVLAELQKACPHPKAAMRHFTFEGEWFPLRPGNVCTDCGLWEEEGWGSRPDSFKHLGGPNCDDIPCISRDASYKLRNTPLYCEEVDVPESD